MSEKKPEPTMAQRVANLEETETKILQILQQVSQKQQQIAQHLDRLNPALQASFEEQKKFTYLCRAMMNELGKEKLVAAANKLIDSDSENFLAQEKAALQSAIDDAIFVPLEKVEDDCFLVGYELDSDGLKVPPGRQQMPFAQVDEKFKAILKDQKPVFEVKTDKGGTFFLTEVYRIDQAKGREVAAKRAQEAADAVKKAEEEAAAAEAAKQATEAPATPEAAPATETETPQGT